MQAIYSAMVDERSRRFAIIIFGALLMGMIIVPSSSASSSSSSDMTYDGSIGVYVDGRRGANSASTRQDWDFSTDLNFEARQARRSRDDGAWSFAFSGRLTSDLDGRRIADEPGIYNGIQETFRGDVQPYLYRAHVTRQFGRSFGAFDDASIRLGRQQRSEGDMLWFDGADIEAVLSADGHEVEFGVFGGVPVRLYESATDDWLLGGSARTAFGPVRVGLEAYHVEEDASFNVTRRDNVGRFSIWAPFEEIHANAYGTIRLIEDDGVDGQLRATWEPGDKGIVVRGDYRFQTEARGAQATELDLASVIMGRTVGATRNAYNEYAGSISFPFHEKATLELGALTHGENGAADRYNFDFDRYFATFGLTGLKFAGMATEISVTGEQYNTTSDDVRTASGEVGLQLTEKLRASAGTTFARYSYDYSTGAVRDNVRIGSLRAEYSATEKCRLEARYDAEDDDSRLHHYLRLGARYDF